MKRIEKINNCINELLRYYEKLDYETQKNFNRIYWNAEKMILKFYDGYEEGKLLGYENGVELEECENITIGVAGYFKYNEAILVYALLSNYGKIYYQIANVCEKNQVSDATVKMKKYIKNIGQAISEKALADELEMVKNFNCEEFCEEFEKLIILGTKALHHKNDEIGEITFGFNEEASKELKEIRDLYEQVRFFDNKIVFYNCITERYEEVSKYDSKQLQYMAMCVFIDIYTKTILWLKKEDPSEMWCPKVPWQLLEEYRLLLDKNFSKSKS